MKAKIFIKKLLLIVPWLFLIWLNYPYRQGIFHRHRGFPFAWETIVTEGVINTNQGLPQKINYTTLLINITTISFVYFGLSYHVNRTVKQKVLPFIHKILFSIEISLITSYATLNFIVSNPYNREMFYYQFVYKNMLAIHKMIRNLLRMSYLNISILMIVSHLMINLVLSFILVSIIMLIVKNTAKKKVVY
jgi:hypothetical protein